MNGIDWIVLLGTMLAIAAYGIWRTRGRRDLSHFLKGDGRSGWITIGLTVMATQASAVTFISTPGQGYRDGLTFVQNYFGAPFAMICLALEVAGQFSLTVGAIVASSVSALIVRELCGYSFATWRFHLRGEVIRGPQDVGWIKQFNAATLMASDFETTPGQMSIAEAQKLFPPGRLKQVVLRAPDGRYGGIAHLSELHSTVIAGDHPISELARQRDVFLQPQMSIRDIMAAFEKTEADVLVVVDNADDRTPIGTVSETHALRVFGEEVERRNQEMYFR